MSLKHKCLILITMFLGLVALPVFTSAQIIPDLKLYRYGSMPSIAYSPDNEIHLLYRNLELNLTYLRLDTALSALSDTCVILNSNWYAEPDIDVRDDHIASTCYKMYSGVNTNDMKSYLFNKDQQPGISAFLNIDAAENTMSLYPKICFINDTLAVAVWMNMLPTFWSDPKPTDICGQLISRSNKLIGGNINFNENQHTNLYSEFPNVCSAGNNTGFTVAWLSSEIFTNKRDLYARWFDMNGNAVDSAILISDIPYLDNIYQYAMDADDAGNILFAWTCEVESTFSIYYRWYNKASDTFSDFYVLPSETDDVFAHSDIDCYIAKNGKSVITWDKRYDGVFIQRLSNDHHPLGDPFRASSNQLAMDYPRVILENDKIFTIWGASGVWANVIDFNNPPELIENGIENSEGTFTLLTNYPNPFNPSTIINYHLSEARNIDLTVFDVSGRAVETLVNSYQAPGHYEINWDATDFPAGIYIYTLRIGNRAESKKMLFLK